MKKLYSTLDEFEKDYEFDFSDANTYLGGGSYGDVWKAYDIHNNKLVAIKIGIDLLKEYEAAKTLKHKNIAQYEACFRISDKKAGIKDYAIMQYYPDGNLHQLLKTKDLSLEQKKEIIKGILEGLQYLHQAKRIHRDFKPSNILIAKTPKGAFVPLIADFGLTKVVHEKDYIDGSDIELSDGRGTLSYKAPEQFIGGIAHYNLDLWAFGVILYEMLTGELPFKRGESGSEQTRIAEQQRLIINVQLPEKLNVIEEPFQAIIRRCLVKDIHKRERSVSGIITEINTKKANNIEEKTDEQNITFKENRRSFNKKIIDSKSTKTKNKDNNFFKTKINFVGILSVFALLFVVSFFIIENSDSKVNLNKNSINLKNNATLQDSIYLGCNIGCGTYKVIEKKNKLVINKANGDIEIYSYNSNELKLLKEIKNTSRIRKFICDDLQENIVWETDSLLIMFDLSSLSITKSYVKSTYQGDLYSISPDGRYIFTHSLNDIFCYNSLNMNLFKKFHSNTQDVDYVCFAPEFEKIFAVGYNGILRCWDFNSQMEIHKPIRINNIGEFLSIDLKKRLLYCVDLDDNYHVIDFEKWSYLRKQKYIDNVYLMTSFKRFQHNLIDSEGNTFGHIERSNYADLDSIYGINIYSWKVIARTKIEDIWPSAVSFDLQDSLLFYISKSEYLHISKINN